MLKYQLSKHTLRYETKNPKQAFFKSFFFLRIETVSIDFRLGKDVAVVKDTDLQPDLWVKPEDLRHGNTGLTFQAQKTCPCFV